MSALISFKQHADDDGERGVVGVAAAQHLARLQAGLGHGPVDRLAAAVDQDGPHADRLHEDDVLQRGLERLGVLHGAAAELDDRQPIAELADVAERLDQHVRFANGIVHTASHEPLPPEQYGGRNLAAGETKD